LLPRKIRDEGMLVSDDALEAERLEAHDRDSSSWGKVPAAALANGLALSCLAPRTMMPRPEAGRVTTSSRPADG
jgi:hypothetical protein